MSLGSDLAAAVALIGPDAALLRSIVQGPAAGPGSIVTLPNGFLVKTLARVSSEAAGPFVQKSGDTMSGSLVVATADDALSLFARGATTAARFLPQPLGYRIEACSPDGLIGKKLFLSGSLIDLVTDGISIARVRNDAFVVGGYLPATSGTTSPLQVDGDLLLRLPSAAISGNAYYASSWRYAGNGWPWALRSDPTGLLQVLGGAENAGGPGIVFTPTTLWSFNIANGHFAPGADGTQNIASPSLRLANLYLTNAPTVTSDATQKRWGARLSEQPGLVKVGLMLPEIYGTFQMLQSIANKGQAAFDALSPEDQAQTTPSLLGQGLARWHIGLTVQELVAIFDTVRLEYPDMPTPAQLGLYGRDPVKTKVARVEVRQKPLMIDEPYSDIEYVESGTHFVARTVQKTRSVPAPPVLKPVRNPDGTPRMIQVGERDTGVVDGQSRRVVEPIMGQEFRPVPATVAVEETVYDEVDLGEVILSTRPDQIHYLCIGAAHIARKALEARVTALEARVTALEAAAA